MRTTSPIRFFLTSAAIALLVVAGCSAAEPGAISAAPEIQSTETEEVADLAPSIAKPAGLETTTVTSAVEEPLTDDARIATLEKAVAQLQADMESNKTEIESKLGLILAEVKGLQVTPQPVAAVQAEPAKDISVAPPAPPAKKAETKKPEAKPAIVKDAKKEMAPPSRKPDIQVAQEKSGTKDKPIEKIVDEATQEKAVAVQKTEPNKPSAPTIMQVRIGEHKDKTRIVLESSAPIIFNADLDNAEKIILVDLKNTSWTAAKEQKLTTSPVVSSYAVQADGVGGQRLVMTLKKAVSLKSYTIKAEGAQPDRLVLDLVSAP